PLQERYPELVAKVSKIGAQQPDAPAGPVPNAGARRRRGSVGSQEPFIDAVYDAALYVDGKDPFMTEMDYRPGEARDLPVMRRKCGFAGRDRSTAFPDRLIQGRQHVPAGLRATRAC